MQRIMRCNKFPYPNDFGNKYILHKNMDMHKKECPLEMVQCTNECGKEMEQKI